MPLEAELPATPDGVVIREVVYDVAHEDGCGFPPDVLQLRAAAVPSNGTASKKIRDMTIAEFVAVAQKTLSKREERKYRKFGIFFETKGKKSVSTFVKFMESHEIYWAEDFVRLSEKTIESLMGRPLVDNGGSLALFDAMYKLRSAEAKERDRISHLSEDYNSPRAVGEPVVFTLVHAEIQQISEVDVVAQRFKAQVFLQFRIKDGAKDPTLADGGDEFPFDDDGKPTFLAPIGWYMNQFNVSNSVSGEPMDWIMRHKMSDGDDLLISLRFAGVFYEDFEVNAFPFDIQALQIRVCVDNCRCEGRTPVVIEVEQVRPGGKPPTHFVQLEGFQIADEWDIAVMPDDGKFKKGSLFAVPYENMTYDHEGNPAKYSSLRLTATIRRKATFYVTNIMIQVMLLTGLGLMQFFLPVSVPEERMAVTLTMVLAIVGFKCVARTVSFAVGASNHARGLCVAPAGSSSQRWSRRCHTRRSSTTTSGGASSCCVPRPSRAA